MGSVTTNDGNLLAQPILPRSKDLVILANQMAQPSRAFTLTYVEILTIQKSKKIKIIKPGTISICSRIHPDLPIEDAKWKLLGDETPPVSIHKAH